MRKILPAQVVKRFLKMLGNSAFIEMNIGILTKHFLVFHAQQCYGVQKNLLIIVARVGFWTNLTFHTSKEGIYGYAFLFIRHFFSYLHKGQVISKQNFGVFNFQKNRIVPFFWFDDPSLEARAETFQKNSLVFGKLTKISLWNYQTFSCWSN